jgi:hypothetical protein
VSDTHGYWLFEERAMPSVSLYVRHMNDGYENCCPKAVYLRRQRSSSATNWKDGEKIPSGIVYRTAKRMALEKELALYRGEIPEKPYEKIQSIQPKPKTPDSAGLMLDRANDRSVLEVVRTKSSPRTYSGYTYTMTQFYAAAGMCRSGKSPISSCTIISPR